MSTPESNVDVVVDESADEQSRKRAIEDLEAANECDELAEVVRNEDLESTYREHALENLAHPQCRPTLESLVESGDVPDAQQERAEALLRETPDDAGAGP